MASKKNTKKAQQTSLPSISPETRDMIIGIGFITVALLVFFSTQPVETTQIIAENSEIITKTGEMPILGKYLEIAGLYLFGEGYRFIFSPILVALGVMLVLKRTSWNSLKLFWLLGFFISVTSLIGWYQDSRFVNIFFNIYPDIESMTGPAVAIIFFLVIFFVSLYLIFQLSYRKILQTVGSHAKNTISQMRTVSQEDSTEDTKPIKKTINKAKAIEEELQNIRQEKEEKEKNHEEFVPPGKKFLKEIFSKNSEEEKEISEEKIPLQPERKPAFMKADKKIPLQDASGNILTKEKEESKTPKNSGPLKWWKFPSLNLLNKPHKQNPISPEEIREKALIIQKTLLQFGIEVEMEQECVGPTVIQYRLRPAEGVKVSKIENLDKDLALALSAQSIRIEAPIPGMSLVGIEVPNDKRDMICIREVLEDKNFSQNHKHELPVALGKDINGNYVIADLAKMPHLLVAGQTGSGKSVGMNGLIMSLLYKKSPAELQMIMVDPKQVELGMYDGIPHLMTPVITSPNKALNALKWTVAEMERRYTIMKESRTKNIIEYNGRVEEKEKIPYIVFIIDELADLMMSGNKKEVETQISRIAQKGRASGMHIIIATQRPSVNVITGLIKANIPSRIAFTVTSQVDSRTILDQKWAESLLGRGDMLYWANGAMYATRVQGMFVDTDEIDNVVREIRLTVLPEDWEPNVPDIGTIPSGGADLGNFTGGIGMPEWFDEDPKIIQDAIELVQSAGKCSTSMLQRHLKLGYGRAARVVDILEEMGIVGPADGSKPREVLI